MSTSTSKLPDNEKKLFKSITPLTLLTALVFLSSATFGVYQSTKSIIRYYDYPLTTSVTERPLQPTDYPYVVLCFPKLIKNRTVNTNEEGDEDFSQAYQVPYHLDVVNNYVMHKYPWGTMLLEDYYKRLKFSNVTFALRLLGSSIEDTTEGPGRLVYSSYTGMCSYFYPWKKQKLIRRFTMKLPEKGNLQLRFVKNIEELHHLYITYEDGSKFYELTLETSRQFRLEEKMTTQLPTKDYTCTKEHNYYQAKCIESCIVADLMGNKKIACALPWTKNVLTETPICNTHEDFINYTYTVKGLHHEIDDEYDNCQTKCPKACTNRIFTLNEVPLKEPSKTNSSLIHISIEPTMKIVTEFAAYELMNVVGDVGGIIGILLGFSVFGVYQMMIGYAKEVKAKRLSLQSFFS